VAYSNKKRGERERINNTPHPSPLPQGEREIRSGKELTKLLTLTLSRKGRGELGAEKLFKDFLPIDGGG
jgi:hypothetical protein